MEKLLEQLGAVMVLVERGVQFIKSVIPYQRTKYQRAIDQALVVLLGAVFCVSFGVDAFSVFFPSLVFPVAWFGSVLTALFLALPANALHELFEILKQWRDSTRNY